MKEVEELQRFRTCPKCGRLAVVQVTNELVDDDSYIERWDCPRCHYNYERTWYYQ